MLKQGHGRRSRSYSLSTAGCRTDANDGQLVFRQTFDGPHVSDKPFTATATSVPIESNVGYIYRVHMYPHGYGGAFKFQDRTGKVSPDTTDYSSSLPELADVNPQPSACTP